MSFNISCHFVQQSLIDELQRIRSFFKILDMEPVHLSTMSMNSSRLGVGIPPLGVGEGSMGRWTGKQINWFKYSSFLSSSFWPRYAPQGQPGTDGTWGHDLTYSYLSSLPDLATPRWNHGCSSFLTSSGELVKISTCCPCFILLYLRSSIDLRSDLFHLTSGPCNGSTGLGVSSFLYVS